MTKRYLTKSKFKIAMECPTKLFYSDKNEYSNLKSEDSFLEALSEGGYQVAALAKSYYPEGITIDAINKEEALKETNKLLQSDNVVIFEAATLYNNLFSRADILIKRGNKIELVEVKSSSYDSTEKSCFFKKNGDIKSEWLDYLLDVAFQKYVLINAYKEFQISASLILVDKNSFCPTNALHQKFLISKDENNNVKIIISENINPDDLSCKILRQVNVDNEISTIFSTMLFRESMSFSTYIEYLSSNYIADIKIAPKPGKICKKCEFKTTEQNLKSIKSGFKECWTQACSFKESDFLQPTVLDIWNFRKTDQLIHAGVFRASQVNEDDINPKSDSKPGWSASERQWIQVEKIKSNNTSVEIDKGGLETEMNRWIYPLHFIDFETIMPAIPFNKGARPYQGLAFQFSHHTLAKNGNVEHVDQFIEDEIGVNPNLKFIRALKLSLEKDDGTILRYATHENTYLNLILNEISNSPDFVPDKEDLISFIKTISKSTGDSVIKWSGNRNMVDLCELVKRFYYDPTTNGSNSIKQVFPAILKRSSYLQKKYGSPIYGSENGIKSLNFENWQWVRIVDDKIIDPYVLLPKLFQDIDIGNEEIDFLFNGDSLKEGGAASIAYSRMQFSEMTKLERSELSKALLKYCELDTLAMVMIVEAWKDVLNN